MSLETGRKRLDAVRSSPRSRNYKIVVRTHQHNTDSAVLQAARCLKTEVQKETRKIKDSIAEKTKDGKARGCMDNCHIT